MKINHAVVPVAGLGTRLLPITVGVAKEMLPLGRKPTLQIIAEELAQSGISNVVLVTSEAKRSLVDYFAAHPALENRLEASGHVDLLNTLWSRSVHSGLNLDVALQNEQNGLGHAVSCAAPNVLNSADSSTHFVVALGDCVIGWDGKSDIVKRMTDIAVTQAADIVIAFESVPEEKVSRFGIASPKSDPNENGVFELADVVEKPSVQDAPSNLAIAARYVLSNEIFDVLKHLPAGKAGEIQLTDAIRQMIKNGAKAYGVRLRADEKRFDVGNLASYTEAFVHFALSDPELSQSVQNAINAEIPTAS